MWTVWIVHSGKQGSRVSLSEVLGLVRVF